MYLLVYLQSFSSFLLFSSLSASLQFFSKIDGVEIERKDWELNRRKSI